MWCGRPEIFGEEAGCTGRKSSRTGASVWLAGVMDNATLAIIVTAVLAVAALGWTIHGVRRMRGNRHLLQGIGLVLLPVGLWLTGIMELLVQGAKALYRFFANTALDTMAIAGIIVGGLGILLLLVSAVVKPVTRADSKSRRLARREQQPVGPARETTDKRAVGAGGPARTSAASVPAEPVRSPKAPQASAAASDEDAEIEALLRKRGIE